MMEGGGGAVVDDDLGGDGMQCSDHPYRNNAPGGGICAFCLQEKLGKLVSSSPSTFFLPSSSSSSPSFRSDRLGASAVSGGVGGGLAFGPASNIPASLSLSLPMATAASSSSSSNGHHSYYRQDGSGGGGSTTRRARLPFLLTSQRMNKKAITAAEHNHHYSASAASSYSSAAMVLKRSKSTATPRRRGGNPYFLPDGEDYSPPKRGGFWSFLYPSKPKTEKSSSSSRDMKTSDITASTAAPAVAACTSASTCSVSCAAAQSLSSLSSSKKQNGGSIGGGAGASSGSAFVVDESADSPNSSNSNATSFGRKVSRSGSVRCGSRSFSGDFFERISTGFGNCTLRRVESQREGRRSAVCGGADAMIKERVLCGGFFSTFMLTSSSCSSTYWLSASTVRGEDHTHHNGGNGKGVAAAPGMRLVSTQLVHGRGKTWDWAFASPMRAFGKPFSKDGNTSGENNATTTRTRTPNLAAIPSLLTVRS